MMAPKIMRTDVANYCLPKPGPPIANSAPALSGNGCSLKRASWRSCCGTSAIGDWLQAEAPWQEGHRAPARGTGYYAAMQRAVDDTRPMTDEQAATLKRLAQAAYELDAFKPNLTRAEADLRIATLTAKLKLLDGPPHTL